MAKNDKPRAVSLNDALTYYQARRFIRDFNHEMQRWRKERDSSRDVYGWRIELHEEANDSCYISKSLTITYESGRAPNPEILGEVMAMIMKLCVGFGIGFYATKHTKDYVFRIKISIEEL